MSSASNCPVCGGDLRVRLRNVRDAVTGTVLEIHRCESCELGVTVPCPAELDPYYENYYGARHGLTARFRASRRLSLVIKVNGRRGGRLLDIGCGDGCFLAAARHAGFQVAGTERNPELARRRGLEIVEDLDEFSEAGAFDCVTLWHSLEHMRDPRSVLKQARRLLRPEGHLIVAVPDSAGAQAKLFGRHWLHLDVPRHLYHFDLKSLNRLFAEENFRITQTWHQEFEYDLLGWSQSMLNALGMRQNAFLDFMMGRDLSVGIPQKAIVLLLGVACSVLAAPVAFVFSLAKSGGTLIVAAQAPGQSSHCEPGNNGMTQ